MIAQVAIGALAVHELVQADIRQRRRRELYNAAMAKARELGRPLVVIGGPGAGAWTRLFVAYGCGDHCLDLQGCPECGETRSVDICRRVDWIRNDSVVVYCSCVLEYVSDPIAAYNEMLRMAGSPENLFIVNVQPHTMTSALYPGSKWQLVPVGDGQWIVMPVSKAKKAAAYGMMSVLIRSMLVG